MAELLYHQAHTGDVCQEVGQDSTKNGCAVKDSKGVERQSSVNSLRNRVKLKVEDYKDKSAKRIIRSLLTNEKEADHINNSCKNCDHVWNILEHSHHRRRLLSFHVRPRRRGASTHTSKRNDYKT